jgi:predicted NodU family carbamoyl transferase
MSVTSPTDSPNLSIEGLESSGPWRDALGALGSQDRVTVTFPGHTPTTFLESSDDLWTAVRSVQDAVRAGAGLTLKHHVTGATAPLLRDFVRFVDDEMRGVYGIEFIFDSASDPSPLVHFLEAASAECVAREVGYRWVGYQSATPRKAPPIGPPQDAEREVEPENVVVAHVDPAQPDYSMALDKVMAPLGDFPRFINPRRLTIGPMDLEAFADEDTRDGTRLRHHARPTPWVLLNLGLYRAESPHPTPHFQLLDSVVVKCLTYGTLPHLAVVVDGEPPDSESFWNLEAYCADRKIPFLLMNTSDVEEIAQRHHGSLTQASAYSGHGEESLVFDYVVSFASVQTNPYVGVLDQTLAQWPKPHREELIQELGKRWKATGKDSEPLTRWMSDAMNSALEKQGLQGLVALAAPSKNEATNARLQPWARRARSEGTAIDLTRAGRPDLWLIEAPEAEILVAGTDPIPIERVLADATGAEDELAWLKDAASAGDPYAKHEGGLVQGEIPDAVLTGPSRLPKHRTGKGFTVLGIGCTTLANHGATLLRDGKIVGAVQEERLRRRKQLGWHPPGRTNDTVVCDSSIALERAYPWRSIQAVLEMGGIDMDDVDCLAYNGVPAKFFSTYSLSDPQRPPKTIRFGRQMFIPHHLTHAASTYRVSGMEDEAFIFTVDGRGERETAAFFETHNGEIRREFDILCNEDTLIGGVYEYITTILGFGHYGQGSTMGLAAMGRPTFDLSRFLSARNRTDHSIHDRGIMEAFGHLMRDRSQKITRDHVNLAASVQLALEDTVLNLITDGLQGRKPKNLCLAGGVALNCSMNQRIRTALGVENIYVQPAAHDAGTSLGAALEAHWEVTGEAVPFHMEDAHLGLGYSDTRIEETLKAFNLPYERSNDIAQDVAELLADEHIVCWFQGRFEFGPRALGARSILADPRSPKMKDRLNNLKRRQSWRPFGPSMLAGYEDEYFELAFESPFMLFTFPVKREMWDVIPAVLHKDGTTRPQSVKKHVLPLYWETIDNFRKLTGVPMVVNTSFNTAHEPIVGSPEDAVGTFLDLGADALAIGNFIVRRDAIRRS